MPTYKQRPLSRKDREGKLPLYRPIDHLAFRVAENRRRLIPYAVAAALAFALFGGFKAYSIHYEAKAAGLLNKGQLQIVVKDYARSQAARVGRMKLGNKALHDKAYDKAIEWFTPVAESKKSPALLRITAEQNIALAHLKKGETSQAISILEKVAKDPENSSDDYTQLLVAYAQEKGGAKEKALEIYQNLSDGSKEPAVRTEAEARKKWLEPETQSSVTLPPAR